MGTSSIRTKVLTSKEIAKIVAGFANEMKAQDIVILDMRELVNFCDYFVIATGTSDRHVKSIAQGIGSELAGIKVGFQIAKGLKGFSSPDVAEGAWSLLDMGDVVAHIFEPNSREFYGLEHLWQDAPKVQFKSTSKKRKV